VADPNGVPISAWPDACGLVTQADLGQAFEGEPFEPGEGMVTTVGEVTLPLPAGCVFYSSSAVVTVGVDVSSTDPAQVREQFDIGKDIGVEDLRPVSGLGDDAYYSGGPITSLRVLSGIYELQVDLSGSTLPQEQLDASARALAEIALSRLPS
jgi:hypothetical protein